MLDKGDIHHGSVVRLRSGKVFRAMIGGYVHLLLNVEKNENNKRVGCNLDYYSQTLEYSFKGERFPENDVVEMVVGKGTESSIKSR